MRKKEMMITYQILYSRRKTLAIQVKRDGQVVVRSPFGVLEKQIDGFVSSHKVWIQKQLEAVEKRREQTRTFSEEEEKQYRKAAREVLSRKTAWWAKTMQVDYGRIAIRSQATRWGSCSSLGNLNYNWKLILLPEPIQDYVVVHELAHRIEMNHSARFWAVVEQYLPDYQERRKQLRIYEKRLGS